MSTIKTGYLVTSEGKLKYVENWYDECPMDADFFAEGLNLFSNYRERSSFADGNSYSSVESVFRQFVADKQFDIKKLVKKLKLTIKDYYEYDNEEEIKNIEDLSVEKLTDYLTDYWCEWNTIPAWIFTDKEILADNFPYFCSSVSLRNYSCAGDWFYDIGSMSDNEPDMICWLERKVLVDEWGCDASAGYDRLGELLGWYQDWANGNVYGLSYRNWDTESKCWSEIENIGGFLGDDNYDIEKIVTSQWMATKDDIIPVTTLEEINKEYGFDAYPVELNDGVLYERQRIEKLREELQPKLFSEEELISCKAN